MGEAEDPADAFGEMKRGRGKQSPGEDHRHGKSRDRSYARREEKGQRREESRKRGRDGASVGHKRRWRDDGDRRDHGHRRDLSRDRMKSNDKDQSYRNEHDMTAERIVIGRGSEQDNKYTVDGYDSRKDRDRKVRDLEKLTGIHTDRSGTKTKSPASLTLSDILDSVKFEDRLTNKRLKIPKDLEEELKKEEELFVRKKEEELKKQKQKHARQNTLKRTPIRQDHRQYRRSRLGYSDTGHSSTFPDRYDPRATRIQRSDKSHTPDRRVHTPDRYDPTRPYMW